jgi:DNA-binding transcriptional MerR regulator
MSPQVKTPPATIQPASREVGTWVLQSDAAEAAGCSVSAIRKWRRLGLVADRTRISPGGMRRVEVRLEDVLSRMRESMPRHRAPEQRQHPESSGAAVAVVPITDLDVFMQHIAETERRAAQAEARLQANDAMTEFLRDRVTDLEAQLHAADVGGAAGLPPALRPELDIDRLVSAIRELRRRLQSSRQEGVRKEFDQRVAVRMSYDAAVICLCTALHIETQFKLGDPLTSAERTRLTQALVDAGLEVAG